MHCKFTSNLCCIFYYLKVMIVSRYIYPLNGVRAYYINFLCFSNVNLRPFRSLKSSNLDSSGYEISRASTNDDGVDAKGEIGNLQKKQ